MYQQPSTILQNRTPNEQDKTPRASVKKQSIIKYSLGPPEDTKPLRNGSGNRAKMFLKSHLRIKFQPIVNVGDWGCIVRDLYIIIGIFACNFIPKRSHHSVTLQKLQY